MLNNLPELTQAKILIVDDEPELRRLLALAMQHEGYQTDEAGHGEQCLAYCRESLPDLILLDAVMPEIDGFTCCETLHSIYGETCPPVLMITALSDLKSVERAFAVGATDFVTKPIHWAVLRQRVRRLLQIRLLIQELQQSQLELQQLKYHSGLQVQHI